MLLEEEQQYIDSFCIAIASHISNPNRIQYLIECLQSLVNQTIQISVYLSISFETPEIRDIFLNSLKIEYPKIFVFIREQKTPQMRHFYLLLDVIKKHKWVMFCDDDDTYDKGRVENIIKSIYTIEMQYNSEDKIFAGLYESHCGKDHREHRHEYWCYCVNKCILERFYDTLDGYDDIIDNKCCDVLFGEYMRRLSLSYFFARLDMRLYNYRVVENKDSVTGVIQSKQGLYSVKEPHPPLGDPRLPEYILDWNDYLYDNLDVYMHDIFLRSIVGCDIDYIFKAEFMANYDLLEYIDECHIDKMKEYYEYLRTASNLLYDFKI
jgi:Glycosyl transferase family 2